MLPGRFVAVLHRLGGVASSGMAVMACLLMVSALMMSCRFAMMRGGVFVRFGGVCVVLRPAMGRLRC